jgi:hypothetical protein
MPEKDKKIEPCRVCGLDQLEPQWGEDGKSPTFNICFCCGVEFGYEDATLTAIRSYREKWFLAGALWHKPRYKPEGWNLEEQLKDIPAEYL